LVHCLLLQKVTSPHFTALNGGFRPGQDAPDFIVAANRIGQAVQVRKTPSWPRPTRDFWANLTAFELCCQHWTINNPAEMRRLLLAGSDGVMTDDVAMGAEVFAEFRPAMR
jgi:hypothetical protein